MAEKKTREKEIDSWCGPWRDFARAPAGTTRNVWSFGESSESWNNAAFIYLLSCFVFHENDPSDSLVSPHPWQRPRGNELLISRDTGRLSSGRSLLVQNHKRFRVVCLFIWPVGKLRRLIDPASPNHARLWDVIQVNEDQKWYSLVQEE